MENFNKDQLLSYLIETLELTLIEDRGTKLDMEDWVSTSLLDPTETDYHKEAHFCGYSACVCGFVALRTLAPHKRESLFDWETRLRDKSARVEKDIARILGSELSNSIVSPAHGFRYAEACFSGLFTIYELGHPHLNSESSIEHAVSYLKMLKEKLI
jgi:hypothetical protein